MLFICIFLIGCNKNFKESIKKSDSSTSFESLPSENQIKPEDISSWVSSLPSKLPFKLQWDQAEQKIINGKHVVAVPINKYAAVFFTKQDNNLKVYAYRWNKNTSSESFTGGIQVFSFQSYGFIGMVYNKNKLIKVGFAKEIPGTQLVKNSNNKTTNGIKQTASLAHWLAATACAIVGGEWVEFNWQTGVGPACQDWFSYSWLTSGNGFTSAPGSSNDSSYGDIYVYGLPPAYIDNTNSSGGGVTGGTPTDIGVGDPNGMYSSDGSYQINTITGDGVVWVNLWAVPDQSGCPTIPGNLTNGNMTTNTYNPHDCDGVAHWTHFKMPSITVIGNSIDLTTDQINWLTNNNEAAKAIASFITLNDGDLQETKESALWSINNLMNNSSISLPIYKNQFLSLPEGGDDDLNYDYWNNPNLTFPAQSLPSYNRFYDAFPKHSDTRFDTPIKMYTAVGGEVLNQYNLSGARNTCALRISRALNYSGVTIPDIKDQTYKGSDNKFYFLGAAKLKAWMIKTFGPPTKIEGSQGGIHGSNFPSLLNGKKGIFIMTPNDINKFQATGHADLLTYFSCDGGCYFDAPGGVKDILIWELQ
ncbi:T6SS effector amidase Tae4 family protein [Mucilaginibacter sp. KACC 22063]|uniref:T6SS effector amidase Tae4 family protein n=1 Tax=Mucilaginibacter sp. KACC 22063 TaxID=3025666 RepID=UPI002366F90F|nr:T6SS effector amidase Tae4 family protein [Mucilaginibacter sp. KACC 22063]WDF53933.1 T6SS effector amidase Tae4 family protein [Mucilaginibacter sp. KACC 22063]